MAKKFSQIKDKKLKALLTNQEVNEVESVEAYIDAKIEAEYPSVQFTIDYCIMRFECNPTTHAPLSHPEPKRQIMQDLLFERLNDAGWKIQLEPKEIKVWKLFL